MATQIADFEIRNEGSIWLFTARTPEAQEWWDDNCETGQMFGGSYVVDWRYGEPILDGIVANGFEITVH